MLAIVGPDDSRRWLPSAPGGGAGTVVGRSRRPLRVLGGDGAVLADARLGAARRRRLRPGLARRDRSGELDRLGGGGGAADALLAMVADTAGYGAVRPRS
jgi:hypothetical protein